MEKKTYSILNFSDYGKSFSNYYESVIVTKQHETDYLEIYKKFKDNKLEDNTSVYITKLSDLPSYKLKNHIEENKLNIKITRKWSELNSIIVSDNFIKQNYFFNNSHNLNKEYYVIPSVDINALSNKVLFGNIKKEVKGVSISHFLIPKHYVDQESILSQFKKYPIIECKVISSVWGNKEVIENYDLFINLKNKIEQYNVSIIFDDTINNEINKNLTIDPDICNTIFSMLKSKDSGNIELAKELIANSSYEESKPYVNYLVNLFPTLRKKSAANKNYELIRNMVPKATYSPEYVPNIEELVPFLIKQDPQHVQEYMNCVKIHMNYILKNDIIKEIQTH